jgi:hypothetical protein
VPAVLQGVRQGHRLQEVGLNATSFCILSHPWTKCFFWKTVFTGEWIRETFCPKKAMYIRTFFTTSILCFPKKPYTLAGFEAGSSVHRADAMTTAPRRQGFCKSNLVPLTNRQDL